MTLNNKIDEILTIFKSKDAKLWKIGTDIFNTIERLFINLEDADLNELTKIELKKNNNPKKFSFFYNGKNITPTHLKKKEVSDSAIRQYIDMLESLNIMFQKKSEVKNVFNGKNESCNLEVSSSFLNTIKKMTDKNNFKISCQIIINALNSNNKQKINLGYSLFIIILWKLNFDFLLLNSNNKIVELQKYSKIFDLSNELEREENFKKSWGDTYKTIVEVIINKTELDSIINFIYSDFDINKNNYFTSESKQIKEFEKIVEKLRFEFRRNIKEDRVNLFLIKKDDIETIYSDLEIYQEENCENNIEARISDLEAAHIFDVWRVKEILKKSEYEDNKEIIKIISDPKNGLLMCPRYHRFFDKKLFNFNINGEMVCNEDDENYLFNQLKLHKVRIKRNVMNEKMKEYLSKRIY